MPDSIDRTRVLVRNSTPGRFVRTWTLYAASLGSILSQNVQQAMFTPPWTDESVLSSVTQVLRPAKSHDKLRSSCGAGCQPVAMDLWSTQGHEHLAVTQLSCTLCDADACRRVADRWIGRGEVFDRAPHEHIEAGLGDITKHGHVGVEVSLAQYPTLSLLDSQSDELLKSLPQLNQTVDELKSFLPSQSQ